MLSTLYTTTPEGMFIYPKGSLGKRHFFYDSELGAIRSEDDLKSVMIWRLYHEFKMRYDILYIIARAINRLMPNDMDWTATFNEIAIQKLWIDQEKMYDRGNIYIPTTDSGYEMRRLNIRAGILSDQLDKEVLADVSMRLKKYSLVP